MQTPYDLMFETKVDRIAPVEVRVADPPIGNKIFCTQERGIYVLERGPAIWRGMLCTHAGSGGVVVYDGVPDHEGFYEGSDEAEQIRKLIMSPDWAHVPEEEKEALLNAAWNYNGRVIYYSHPACMGMWMLDGGVHHGLTLVSSGEIRGAAPVLTITWARKKQ